MPAHQERIERRGGKLDVGTELDVGPLEKVPPREECAICMRVLPIHAKLQAYAGCCGKTICAGCDHQHPISRTGKHAEDGAPVGVMGNVELLNSRIISTQPIVSFDWSPDKDGLAVMAALDQTVRVQLVTKLDKY